ncbi:pyridoxal phosphate-dependent aminotransferase [Marinobacterium arenosum]|uniref:pyridoxal phosphate-dependent aminotransferase n=1 Tax=Marinobacterium arenosum TaxID=2862496 RepID=UPI001C938908|nr:pyridoxal phosphate-dependent aminotransferase [Marinobacterium arenosum]MBY4678292.1 pyridoxal phosphate-dependent aminotransferase [Marinobacterium arenosum]
MTAQWTRRAVDIQSFKVMDLLKRAKELDALGHDVVHMEAGEPDFATAAPIAEAAKAAIEQGLTQYTASAGIMPLREAISDWYRTRYGLDIPPQRIIVTSGASGALLMVFSLLAEQGRSFMMSDPGYPCNRQFLRLIEARGQLVPVDASDNFQLTPALIEQHWQPQTAGVLLASPSNPTGAVVGRDQLRAISETVRQLDGQLVVDELYHGLTYGFDASSVLEVDPDAFVINSFSKYFGMTGWRLGWMVVPEAAAPEVEKLAQNLFISPCTISQYAALAAFKPQTLEILEQRRQAFAERRDLLVGGLRELGFDIPVTPEGAFYVYAGASHLTSNTFDYCWSLLEQDKVAVTPGVDFGSHHADQYIRFSYTTGLDRIELALERLQRRIGR